MAGGCVGGGSLAMEPGAPPGHAMPCEGLRLGNAMPFCIPFSFARIWGNTCLYLLVLTTFTILPQGCA